MDRNRQTPPLSLEVTISEVLFVAPHNYFVVLTLDDGLADDSQGKKSTANLRTEVCSEVTSSPRFRKKSITMDVVHNFAALDANLKVGAFQVSKKNGSEAGAVELTGNCIIPLRKHIVELQAGHTISVKDSFMANGERTTAAEVGTLRVRISLTDPGRVKLLAPKVYTHSDATHNLAPEREAKIPSAREAVSLQQESPPRPPPSSTVAAPVVPSPEAAPSSLLVHPVSCIPQHVSRSSYRIVSVAVRCAINLPKVLSGGKMVMPTPFVAVKSARDAAARLPANSSTTAVRTSRHPIWNQTLVVDVLQEDLDAGDGTVLVAVINLDSKRRIAQVAIPAHRLVPMEQYNLDINLPAVKAGGTSSLSAPPRLYLSVLLHDSTMGETALLAANPHLTRLEVLLKGCAPERPLPCESDETLAAVRLIPNIHGYISTIAKMQASLQKQLPQEGPGVVGYPQDQFSPVDGQSLCCTGQPDKQLPQPSSVQITSAVGPGDRPVWNQAFYFTYPTAEIAADEAALVVEIYQRGIDYSDQINKQHTDQGISSVYHRFSRAWFRRHVHSADDVDGPVPELFIGYLVLPLAHIFCAPRPAGTAHVFDELALTLIKACDRIAPPAVNMTWLQFEVYNWSASVLSLPETAAAKRRASFVISTIPANSSPRSLSEHLVQAIEEHKNIIRRCGADIIRLRHLCAKKAARHSQLRFAMPHQLQLTNFGCCDNTSVDLFLSWGEIRQCNRRLPRRSKSELELQNVLVAKLRSLEIAAAHNNALCAQIRHIEGAHGLQSKAASRLRSDNIQVLKYCKTVQEQEAVIVRLEHLALGIVEKRTSLKAQVEDSTLQQWVSRKVGSGNLGRLQDVLDATRLRRIDVKRRVVERNLSVRQLRKVLQDANLLGIGDRDSLIMRAQYAATKAVSLDKQLVTNAKTFANEISALKVHIAS